MEDVCLHGIRITRTLAVQIDICNYICLHLGLSLTLTVVLHSSSFISHLGLL